MEQQIFYMVFLILQFLLLLKSKNEIVSGLIFDPIKDEMFYAEKNKGAFLNNQRLRVSKKNL
jgi:myo-inositol-1(or 4)-monophosphatase